MNKIVENQIANYFVDKKIKARTILSNSFNMICEKILLQNNEDKIKYSIKKVPKTIPCENISEKYDFSQKCMIPKLPKENTHSKVEDIQNSLNSITKALNEKNRLVDNNNSNKIDVYSKSEDSKNNVDFPKLIKSKVKSIANLEPGYLSDTNILMHFEDYPEFLSKGKKFG